jgi:hypothetical protein
VSDSNLLLAFCFAFFLWLVFGYWKLGHQWLQSPYLAAWRQFAAGRGLNYLAGTFFGPAPITPRIRGEYRGREIEVSANTLRRWTFRGAETHYSLSLHNPVSAKYPMGASLLVYNTRRATVFRRYVTSRLLGEEVEQPLTVPGREMKSFPPNVGNYLLHSANLGEIMVASDFSGLLIQQEHLLYQHKHIPKNAADLQTDLDRLCDLAEVYEGFAKAWLH